MPKPIIDAIEYLLRNLPFDFFTTGHTLLGFVFIATGPLIYRHFMLDDYGEINDWKERLQWIAFWIFIVILGHLIAHKELGMIFNGETCSVLFVLGFMAVSVAYMVFSIRVYVKPDGCIKWWVSFVIILRSVYDFLYCVLILIQH